MRCIIYPLSNATEQVGLPRSNKWALGKVEDDDTVSFKYAARTKRQLVDMAAEKGWEVVADRHFSYARCP
jgi:hypothetical protein